MNILFLYYNEGFVLKAYELEEYYFVEFSFHELCKTYPCSDRLFAIELSKGLADFYTKDLQKLKKMLKFDEDLNSPFF
jgi:hypothetical protein